MAATLIRAFNPHDCPALARLWQVVHPHDPYTAEELEREDRTAPFLVFAGDSCVAFTQVYASEASPELQTGLTGSTVPTAAAGSRSL